MIKRLKRFINLLPETWERANYPCGRYHPITTGATTHDSRYPRVGITVRGSAVDVLCPFNVTNEEYGMVEHFRVDAVMNGDTQKAHAIAQWQRRNPWFPNDQNTYYCPTCNGGMYTPLPVQPRQKDGGKASQYARHYNEQGIVTGATFTGSTCMVEISHEAFAMVQDAWHEVFPNECTCPSNVTDPCWQPCPACRKASAE